MAFLQYCDQYKAFNKMPNQNFKKTVPVTDCSSSIIDGLLREIDTLRALEMPQPQPTQPQKQWQWQRQLPQLPLPPTQDIYASFRGCARQQQSYAFSNLNYKKTRLNGGPWL
jgi:hypothetical protein